MLDCLISSVEAIGKCILIQCVWPSLKFRVDYWWRFDDNIQQLKDGIRDLERQTHDIQQKIEVAGNNAEILRPGVREWLNSSIHKLQEARTTLPNDNIPEAWKLISRYSWGKIAKETAEEIAKHLNNGKFDLIADPLPPAAMASPPHRSSMDFESRKGIEEDIIKSLKESSVSMVGICGMGGVGKTTMAKRIWERVKDENLFDEVVMVTVSQKIEMPKIQNEIADLLKLNFAQSSMPARAHQLRTRLMDAKNKIIIFDDVWESLRFEDLGIPIESNFKGCKVLFTSRSREICKDIQNKKVFELKVLREEEAWNLFREKAGEFVEDSALLHVAKDVVKECKGLPIALVTVGLALRDEMNIRKWKDSLSQLRKSNPTDFSEVLRDVYKPLKLSYDCLDNDRERYIFLLCCLFPEDFQISVDELTLYSMGLGLLDGISTIEEARNRTHTLIKKLESRFLLIGVETDRKNELEVKMHDVIRDVAIYIVSREKDGFLMSVDISMEVPVLSRFPKLRLLMLHKWKWGSTELAELSDISFEGMKELNVLSFQNASIGSLPPTLGSLENLQTLCLFECEVQNISVIGKLTSLKILNCRGCAKITELPEEIRSLSGLRLLELSHCKLLQTIPFGVISSLGRLEELKMRGSFSRWEAEGNGKEKRNASLTELGSLLKLSCLEIEIDDCTLSAQEIYLPQNLVKYYIRIGSYDGSYYESRNDEKVMILNFPNRIGAVGKWIQTKVRNTEGLYLEGEGSGSNNFNIAEIVNLRNLRVRNCSTLNKLVETKDCKFHCLKSIKISSCSELRSLFLVSAARCLLQLEVLEIQNCVSMEQVFWNEIRDDNTDGCIEFPKLKKLNLWNLPNLRAFCQGLENIVIKCPNLEKMRFGELLSLKHNIFHLSSEIPCNLKSIQIDSFSNLKYLFSGSGARTIRLQLEVLAIRDFESMEQVFWNEGTGDVTDGCIEFPKLKELKLRPNLTSCCQGLENIVIKFPNLTKMAISFYGEARAHATSSPHFVCNPKVEMGCLKDLEFNGLGDTVRNLWCHQIRNNVFNNLEILYILSINGIKSLMSPSIAKNLVNLKYLTMNYCKEMVEVIERDDDDKQVIDNNCLFPNLRELGIYNLPKLIRIWQWNHTLELPLLDYVHISNCPVMETFTLGFINTPNIVMIEVNDKKMDEQKGLNDVIRHIWIESQDTSKADGDRNGSENENEDKNKSKDEYNNGNVNKDEDSNEKS